MSRLRSEAELAETRAQLRREAEALERQARRASAQVYVARRPWWILSLIGGILAVVASAVLLAGCAAPPPAPAADARLVLSEGRAIPTEDGQAIVVTVQNVGASSVTVRVRDLVAFDAALVTYQDSASERHEEVAPGASAPMTLHVPTEERIAFVVLAAYPAPPVTATVEEVRP